MLARVEKGSSGKFYVMPISVFLSGLAFKDRGEAQYVANAINAAYERGKSEIKAGLRELIGAAAHQEVEQ